MAKRRRGHYCWSCDRHRANERFSGKGHARHLCRDCSRLSKDELEFRQAVRDVNRATRWGRLSRKTRPQVERFLRHASLRVQEYAAEVLKADREEREEWRRIREEEEAYYRDELERVVGLWLAETTPVPSDEELASDAFFLDQAVVW
jgi:hypothetical protein